MDATVLLIYRNHSRCVVRRTAWLTLSLIHPEYQINTSLQYNIKQCLEKTVRLQISND